MSVCVPDNCKSNQPISLKLGVVIGPSNQKNWLTFGGDQIPDTHSGSLFNFSHQCGIVDFKRFITISHTVTDRFLRHSVMNKQHLGSGKHPDRNPD